MPTIRIDDDVMRELENYAISTRMVFGSPNQVLRLILKLDGKRIGSSISEVSTGVTSPVPDVPAQHPQSIRRRRTASGSKLLREHGERGEIDANVKSAFYHKEGRGFTIPKEYPAVFFSPSGFVIIKSEKELKDKFNIGSLAHIPGGIETLDGYKECDHSHIE